ncbi:hypothetical protein APSETT444_003572 [Aspergillus pseudonomiae]
MSAEKNPRFQHAAQPQELQEEADFKNPGVKRIAAISSQLGVVARVFLFFGIFLVAYVYGLDGQLRVTYQPLATSAYAKHSLLTTINVLRSVIAAAAQPTAAKIADVFGRVELILLSVFFYTIVCSIPLFVTLLFGHHKAKKASAETYTHPIRLLGAKKFAKELFWYLDVMGILLLIAFLALILVPFTIAGAAAEQWKTAKILAPLIIGLFCLPLFVIWERSYARYPMVPFKVSG